jgi:glutaredoxin
MRLPCWPRRLLLPGVLAVAALVVVGLGGSPAHAQTESDDPVIITLFWGDGCPHCAAEEAFLDDLVTRYPGVVVEDYEVWYDATNRARFAEVAAEHGIEPGGVPTTFIAGRSWVGFSDAIAAEIEAAVLTELAARDRDADPTAEPDGAASPQPSPTPVEVPIIGRVDPATASLVAVTGLIALVDGFNPCSLWVLSILLAMMLHSGSRRRLVAVGFTFLVITAAAYGLFMLGLFAVMDWIGFAPWLRIGIAALVGVLGVLAIRDFFGSGRGFSLSIPEDRKPGIARRSRELALSNRSLFALVPLTALLATGVSLLELPCTAGFPVMWNGILAERGVVGIEFAGLLAIYLGIYLVDELAVFGVAAATMRVTKMQEHHGRALKLIAGSVMVALAAAMLVAPDLLETIGGAILIFGLALMAAAAVLVVTRGRTGPVAGGPLRVDARARRARARQRAAPESS